MLALAGGLLAAAAKTAIDILNWAESARQAVHVERMHAVKRVFQRARVVREQAILDWRRIHTVLVDHMTGQSQEIRLFHDHDETDRQAEALQSFRRATQLDPAYFEAYYNLGLAAFNSRSFPVALTQP